MIRAVTFDCWGTLITDRDMTRASAARTEALARLCGADDAANLLDRAWRFHHDEWVSGRHCGSEGIAAYCVRELGAGDVDELCAALEEASLEGVIEAVDGAAAVLGALRDAGIRTALVCDTGFSPGRILRRLLHERGLAEHLEHLAFSNEVGVPKPGAKIFRSALDALGVPPREAAHVGDLRRTDVAGGRALGMRTVRTKAVHDDPHGEEADAVVSSLHELTDVLRSFGCSL